MDEQQQQRHHERGVNMSAPTNAKTMPPGTVKIRTPQGEVEVKIITEKELAQARAKATDVIERARAFITIDHPFFATPMFKKKFDECLAIPTLAVDPTGNIIYNPFFVATMSTQQQIFAHCHELLHYLSGHTERYLTWLALNGLDDSPEMRKLWNHAADYWINDTLGQSGIGEQPPGTLKMPGAAQRTVEDIADELLKKAKQNQKSGKDKSKSGDPNGEPNVLDGDMDHDGEDGTPLSDAERQEIEAQRKQDVQQAYMSAKAEGKLPGLLGEFAAKTVESKTPWFELLERWMLDRAKTEQSWARPNRRYSPSWYLPTNDHFGRLGEIAVVIDISGSVSEREIDHYNGHIKRIVEQCRPSKVHLLYTDTQVQKHEEYDNPSEVEIRFYSGGGTNMPAAFEFMERNDVRPDVVTVLTDGYTGFGKEEEYPVIWCISSKDITAPWGTTVHFEIEV